MRKRPLCFSNIHKSGRTDRGPGCESGERKVARWHGAGPHRGNGPEERITQTGAQKDRLSILYLAVAETLPSYAHREIRNTAHAIFSSLGINLGAPLLRPAKNNRSAGHVMTRSREASLGYHGFHGIKERKYKWGPIQPSFKDDAIRERTNSTMSILEHHHN